MNKEHVISDEVLEILELAILRNETWMLYNNSSYFIEKEDVHFFKEKTIADEFVLNKVSGDDQYIIINVKSISDVLRQIPYGEALIKELNLSTKILSIMNEKNYEYLKENLKYAGFAERLNEKLEAGIKGQQPEFTLKLETEVNKQPVKTELYFKKSNETDMYFFNKYDIELKNEKEGQQLKQTFYINQGHGVTLKEAYNLLNGRAVHKELENKEEQKYKAWIKLDFSEKDTQGNFKRQQFHENYGYNLNDTLNKYPIKELLDEKQKEDLVKSLQKGNVQVVTIEMEGKEQRMFIEANPQFKTINIYDMKMQKMEKQSLQQNKEEEKLNEKQDQKKSLKAKVEDELDNRKGKRQGKKKGMSL